MKPVKLLKPNMKPMERTPKRSSASGNGLFWIIVAFAVLYVLVLMSGCAGRGPTLWLGGN